MCTKRPIKNRIRISRSCARTCTFEPATNAELRLRHWQHFGMLAAMLQSFKLTYKYNAPLGTGTPLTPSFTDLPAVCPHTCPTVGGFMAPFENYILT